MAKNFDIKKLPKGATIVAIILLLLLGWWGYGYYTKIAGQTAYFDEKTGKCIPTGKDMFFQCCFDNNMKPTPCPTLAETMSFYGPGENPVGGYGGVIQGVQATNNGETTIETLTPIEVHWFCDEDLKTATIPRLYSTPCTATLVDQLFKQADQTGAWGIGNIYNVPRTNVVKDATVNWQTPTINLQSLAPDSSKVYRYTLGAASCTPGTNCFSVRGTATNVDPSTQSGTFTFYVRRELLDFSISFTGGW